MQMYRIDRAKHGWTPRLLLGVLLLVALGPAAEAAVYIEDSPAATRLAEEADELLEQSRFGQAAQKLQEIADDYADKLMPVDATGYTDARRWVRQQIAADSKLLESYRRRYDAVARRALGQADAQAAGPRETRTRQVLDRYALTSAGFDAALRLAGVYLERGDAAGALATLGRVESHPDRAATNELFLKLRAWALAIADDRDELRRTLDQLENAGGPDAVDSLAKTLETLTPIQQAAPPAIADPPPLDRPLWQVAIEPAVTRRVLIPRTLVGPQNTADTHNDLLPVTAGSLLLVNDNDRVFALDRVSGRLRWAHQYQPPADDEPNRLVLGNGRVVRDRREVLVRGDGVYAVLGFAVPWQGRHQQRSIAPTQLVALDRETGQPRWSVTPGELDSNLARAAFHGTPVALGDQIIVMARRSQASSFQDSYLFAVNATTGELHWRRHLASTSGSNTNNRSTPPAMSSMMLADETIYLSDNLGAAAAVDGRNGSVLWVRRLVEKAVDQRRRPNSVALPFSEAARPQLCPAGLIVPMRIEQARGLLLDPITGEVQREFTANSPIADAYEIRVLDNGDVLTVGNRLSRLAGDTLEPIWSATINSQTNGGASPRVSIRPGLAMVSDGTGELQEIDLDSGSVIAKHTLAVDGSVVATPDAWVVTVGNQLSGHLDWAVAYTTLRRRADSQPGSPQPGLNMAILAFNAGQPDAADEGVARALRALSLAGPGRREFDAIAVLEDRKQVIGELLELTERSEALPASAIEKIFDRLATAAETPAELLAYNVARGDFLASKERLAEAVDFYQAVLLDPQQADESLSHGTSQRRGDVVARTRLIRAAEQHGNDFYDRYDREAELELDTLLSAPSLDIEALLTLVRRYPLAGVQGEAIFIAAQQQAKSSSLAGGVIQYRRAYRLADNDDLRGRAAGALASLYQSIDRPDAASRWLEQVIDDRPGLTVVREGLPTDPRVWLEELAELPRSQPAEADVYPPFSGEVRIAGQLVPGAIGKPVVAGPAGVLYEPDDQRGSFAFFSLEQQRRLWTIRPEYGGWQQISQDREQLVLWQPQRKELLALDARTGQELWPAAPVQPLLDDLGEGGLARARKANAGGLISVIEADFGPINRRRNRNQLGNNQNTSLLTWAGEGVVGLVDRKGRAIGLDRTNGQVLWQSALPLDTAIHARVTDDVLAVTGVVSPRTESESGRLLLIDLATGRLRFPPIEGGGAPIDLLFPPGGDPVVLTNKQITRYSRRDGGVAWRLPLPELRGTHQAVSAGDVLFVYSHNRLLSIDLDLGRLTHESREQIHRRNASKSIAGRGGLLYNLKTEGSFAFDQNLVVRWRDALSSTPKQLLTQAVSPNHVFVFDKIKTPEGTEVNRLSALDRVTGRLLDQTAFPLMVQARSHGNVVVLPNHLLIEGSNEIVLVPGRGQETPPSSALPLSAPID